MKKIKRETWETIGSAIFVLGFIVLMYIVVVIFG